MDNSNYGSIGNRKELHDEELKLALIAARHQKELFDLHEHITLGEKRTYLAFCDRRFIG